VLEDKIISVNKLARLLPALKKSGKRIVFTNGCFDLLHYGHVKYLQEARRKGDILIVGLNSDSSIRKIKGPKRPLVGEKERLRVLAGLESVTYAVLFSQATPLNIISVLKPDILIKGADWHKDRIVGSDIVKSYGGKVLRIKVVKGLSSTNLIKKIAKSFSRNRD